MVTFPQQEGAHNKAVAKLTYTWMHLRRVGGLQMSGTCRLPMELHVVSVLNKQ